ncbi:hypothetical protein MASR2M18_15830 [Ignavibacteria bacterium]|nr:hypothetical protein [Bacteroidota bacterium]MCZ2133181.1 hypothetical protein [Bacteroidota bacterium]
MSAAYRIPSQLEIRSFCKIAIQLESQASFRLLSIIGQLDEIGAVIESITMPSSIICYARPEILPHIYEIDGVEFVDEFP